MCMIQNPVMSGFYPDPSICHVERKNEKGEVIREYYMVHSTFCYVPGIPVFYSTDLCSWELISHVLTRKEQLRFEGASMSQGIYAPCIRYHEGMFFVTCTNVSDGGNFYTTAKDPRGPWSDLIYLPDAEGIDPSLYFEGDTCYYVGQRTKKDAKYNGDCEIWLQELDLKEKKLIGPVSVLWDGALKNAVWPEGPHIYKKGEYYYLMIAEGGTAFSHSICIARSKDLRGPYEASPNNPVFTHRHLGNKAEVQNVGHADLVEHESGKWYAFMLGTRPINGVAPLGRETFVAEVEWQEDWPVINPLIGMLSNVVSRKKQEKLHWTKPLDPRCLIFRYPLEPFYRIQTEQSGEDILAMELSEKDFSTEKSPAYIGIRVTNHRYCYETKMEFTLLCGGSAGLVYLYDEKNYVKFVFTEKEDDCYYLQLILAEEGKEAMLTEQKSRAGVYGMKLALDATYLQAYLDGEAFGSKVDVSNLTSEKAGGFVGCTMGVYTGGAKAQSDTKEYVYFSGVNIIGG